METTTFFWEEEYSDTIEDKVNELLKNHWQIVSVCITEYRTNGIKVRPTKGIIIASVGKLN